MTRELKKLNFFQAIYSIYFQNCTHGIKLKPIEIKDSFAIKTLKLSKSINDILRFTLSNTEPDIKNKIENSVKEKTITLEVRGVTYNKVNMFNTTEIEISLDRIVKTYESFIKRF
jgi:hypothetical protein